MFTGFKIRRCELRIEQLNVQIADARRRLQNARDRQDWDDAEVWSRVIDDLKNNHIAFRQALKKYKVAEAKKRLPV